MEVLDPGRLRTVQRAYQLRLQANPSGTSTQYLDLEYYNIMPQEQKALSINGQARTVWQSALWLLLAQWHASLLDWPPGAGSGTAQ
jgi:hypothetical protein